MRGDLIKLNREKAEIKRHEDERKRRPTKFQIKEVRNLFRDFGFDNIEIPECSTFAELDMWRRNELRNRLQGR